MDPAMLKSLTGATTLLFASTINLLRSFGVDVSPTITQALNEWLTNALGFYLIIQGYHDALCKTPPMKENGQ